MSFRHQGTTISTLWTKSHTLFSSGFRGYLKIAFLWRIGSLHIRQVRNDAHQIQDAVIHTRRLIELCYRSPHQILTFSLQFAKPLYLPDSHICVAKDGMFEIEF